MSLFLKQIGKLAVTAWRRGQTALIVIGDHLTDCAHRAAQRRRLMELSDLGLRDIGISRAEARAEYRKPVWRR